MKDPKKRMCNLLPQSRVEINLNALARNVRRLKAKCALDVALMAVVKANAYGHGAVNVSRTALENGASFLAVARIHEAVELREAGIDAPILLFGDVLPCQVEWLLQNDVRITVGSLNIAKEISEVLLCLDRQQTGNFRQSTIGQRVKVHVKVDTGMGRLGFVVPLLSESDSYRTEGENRDFEQRLFDNVVDQIIKITTLEGIDVEGIYTHFANADTIDKSHVNEQIKKFNTLVNALSKRGFKPKICHAANSAAIMDISESHFNMVRAGIAMYGLLPSDEVNQSLVNLEPVMSVRSKIIHLKDVPSGFKVSYGSTHETPIPTKIATVPIGYADGYNRLLSSKGEMLIRGRRCRVAGRVCMDYTMVDVGAVPDVAVGDDVVIMGSQGEDKISADEIARHISTINYEVVCSLSRRMPLFEQSPPNGQL